VTLEYALQAAGMGRRKAISSMAESARAAKLFLRAGLLCLFAWTVPATALSPGARFVDYEQERWTVEDGLPQISVMAITQDLQGYLWLATQNGIARFDGSRFSVFNRANTGLDVNLVTSAYADSVGNVWFGTPRGVLQFGAAQPRLHQSIEDPLQVLDIIEWPQGRLLLATARGVRGLDFVPIYLQSEAIHAFAVDGNGALWVGGDAAIWRIDSSGIRRIAIGSADTRVTQIVRYGARMAVGTTQGAFLLDVGSGQLTDAFPELTDASIARLSADGDGNLWAAAIGELQRLRPDGAIERIDTRPLLEQPWLHAMFEDRNGDLWLGDQRESLIRVSDSAVAVIGREQGLQDDLLWSVLDNAEGGLWVGSNAGLQQWHPQGFFDPPVDSRRLSDSMIYSLFRDSAGRVWAGTGDGPAQVMPEGLLKPESLRDIHGRVTSFVEDGDSFWIGTLDGLWRVRSGVAKRIDYRPGSPLQRIRNLWLESPGQLLVATEGGVRRMVGDAILKPEWADALEDDIVTAFYALRPDILLIGTFDRGLGRLQDSKLTLLTSADGLPTNNVWAMRDIAEHLYVSSSDGAYRIDTEALLTPLPGQLRSEVVVESVSRARGTRRMGCCNGGGAARIAVLGQILNFPTTRGLVQLETAQFRSPASTPTPVLERITVGGVEVMPGPVIHIDGEVRDLAIEYTAVDLRHSERSEFRYRLMGYNDQWTDVHTRRLAVFTGLPPGDYQFELQARFPGNAWRSADVLPRVTIAPQWHERLPIRLGALALLLWLGLYASRRYAQKQRQQRDLLEREVQARTLALARANERLRTANEALLQESRTDVLTGIANRRAALQALAETDRYCLLLIDVDRFKSVNDRFGHAAGDRVLNDIALLTRELTPLPGLVARWGGEEFLLVLPHASMPDGIALANRIRVQIASHSFGVAPQQSLRVTVSIGVCGHPTQGAPASAWPLALELADRALYRAKSSGRNRAVGLSVLALPKSWTGLDTADIDVLLNSDAIRWHLSDH